MQPRFKQELVAEPLEDNGVRFIDVMDPDSGNVFRFYEVEYSLACAMDGERSMDALAQWTFAELGIETSAEELSNVVNTHCFAGSVGSPDQPLVARQRHLGGVQRVLGGGQAPRVVLRAPDEDGAVLQTLAPLRDALDGAMPTV